ncbi:M1 family metallopeptidase [Xanthomonas campestris pv. trichodesmae]|uniref:Aminopeptidase n=3 Tax=Xanthomonas TaxID=338 RepID=A0AB33CUU6_XANCI|nr:MULTISPECIES: M1 family metallopeptidase [Xanthomonas]MBV6783464.1 M1 family metallopeptidase [Xanthomonas campestris pv. trichodesmae]ASK93958.1 aminopeptidase [Xanthomonas citri pv. vignicola]MBB4725971.1 aminopeptidase N [Xanthomonas euvesicatoria]MBB4872573.1 aminopeptidase N [Xanthomonas euvesicatoria]MBZ3918462.1 aminopeptidase [Xanthomonas campestris pv. trichodesmae]
MRSLLVTAILLALSGTSLVGDAKPVTCQTTAESTTAVTTQLPCTAKPYHYSIDITPHAEAMTFDGKVKIELNVLESTDRLVLHAGKLQIAHSNLQPANGKAQAAQVSMDEAAQTATFSFKARLTPGKYTLSIDYSGVINTQPHGLFALDYVTSQGKRRALYTQFEAADARSFVPSWDEPNYKATFDLAVNAPADQMVVSNMPLAPSTKVAGDLKRFVFRTSPKMSTYLLFMSMGAFERATVKTKTGTEIGVIAQKGKVSQAQFALESGRDVLTEYNDYFGVPYPLPKLDNIAAPGQSQVFGAMENWGAIFTFEKTMLLDPDVSSIYDKQGIFTLAAHEIAHQWFGNLVTMAWWDDLWLNEGFANWMESRTTAKLHPEWDVDRAGAAYKSRAAMLRDGYATTHPVVQPIGSVDQVPQAFDQISYQKGEAVVAMLEDYVGSDTWRGAVRNYIKKYQYDNAITDQLWRQVEAVAPDKRFTQVAHDFTLQSGVPLIKVSADCIGGQTNVTLTQGEYTLDRPAKQPMRWHVPVALRQVGGEQTRVLVDGTAHLKWAGCDKPVLVNAGQKGYFRTLYAPAQFKALSNSYSSLQVVDQLGLLLDTVALSAIGLQPQSDSLDLTTKIAVGATPDLWDTMVDTFDGVDDMFKHDTAGSTAWRAYARPRLSEEFSALGWDDRDGDSAQIKKLRGRLLISLSGMEDASVIAEARRRFAVMQKEPTSFSPDVRKRVLNIAARNADDAIWEALHGLAKKEKSSMVRDLYYSLLATVKNDDLAQRALDMALTSEPGTTLGGTMIRIVADTHPELALNFALAHREKINTMVGPNVSAGYFPRLGSTSTELKTAEKIKDYADKYLTPTTRSDADTIMKAIQTRAKLQATQLPQVLSWLKEQDK